MKPKELEQHEQQHPRPSFPEFTREIAIHRQTSFCRSSLPKSIILPTGRHRVRCSQSAWRVVVGLHSDQQRQQRSRMGGRMVSPGVCGVGNSDRDGARCVAGSLVAAAWNPSRRNAGQRDASHAAGFLGRHHAARNDGDAGHQSKRGNRNSGIPILWEQHSRDFLVRWNFRSAILNSDDSVVEKSVSPAVTDSLHVFR